MSNPDPRTQQAIAEGEAAWLKITSGNWDESGWKIMGTALTLMRQQVLFDLGTNVARGSIYNTAFARRLDGTAFKSMDASTRSNLLFVMEPPNRLVLDRLMAEWTPDQRARRTHPATLARAIRAALRPPKPAPSAKDIPVTKPVTKPASPDDAALVQELAQVKQELAAAKARIRDMGLERLSQAQAFRDESNRRARNARPKVEKPPLPPDEVRDRRIKAQSTEIRNLKGKLRDMEQYYAKATAHAGGMPRETRNAIDWVLQPDQRRNATEVQWDKACKGWNVWKGDNDKAQRRAR